MDLCAVCAEPLEWTACGPCGHMETCSKCVAQMRLIMDDTRCVICQQELKEVFVTRFMGDYTKRLTPNQFSKLQEKAKNLEVFHEPTINAFFDDEDHYKEIKSISSYTHPILEGVSNVPSFTSIGSLRRFIKERLGKQFCSICLEGRKVFLSEQILYDKKDLARHLKQGDISGPLAVAGFKGHPQCMLCSKRFYSDHELFLHNQRTHETCFLCRRINPGQYTYYRNYEELEGHFRSEHHPCPHPSCLEKKFVVFSTEAELRQHYAREHKEDSGGLSRAKLREALALETNFQLRRGVQEEAGTSQLDNRAAIVLGGGSNMQHRGRTPQRGQQTSVPVRAAQGGNVVQDAESGPSRRPDLTGADFPALQNNSSSGSAGNSAGNWAGRGGVHQGPTLQKEDFPVLPSCNGKKVKPTWVGSKQPKAPQRKNWGSTAPQPSVKVIKTAQAKPSKPTPTPPRPGRKVVEQVSSQRKSPPERPGPHISQSRDRMVSPSGSVEPALPQENFPALSSSEPKMNGSVPNWKPSNKSKEVPKKKPTKQDVRPPAKEDFPNLSAKTATQSKAGPSQRNRVTGDSRPNITEELKATTKSLASQIKKQVERSDYDRLKAAALDFCEGILQADDYHDIIVDIGIVQYAGELAAVCPVVSCGQELLEVHRRFVELAKLDPASVPASVPVSVLATGLKLNEEVGLVWSCTSCKVLNAPQADFCEKCGSSKPIKKQSAGGPSSSTKKRSSDNRKKIPGHYDSAGLRKRDNEGLFNGKVASKAGSSPWGRN